MYILVVQDCASYGSVVSQGDISSQIDGEALLSALHTRRLFYETVVLGVLNFGNSRSNVEHT